MNIQQRVLNIKDFKNIGVSKLDEEYHLHEKPEKLLIDVNYAQDSAGGLVIVIGENNTGKSNVNKALAKFAYKNNKAFDYNDTPNYIGYNECQPRLELQLKAFPATANTGGGGISP